ncbi:MAG: hypothetical protein WAN36_12520 [Calditrichia bacterium]
MYVNTYPSAEAGGLTALPALKSGDRIGVRVVQRVSAFRYTIAFRGKHFPINSELLLKPQDLLLVELRQVHPRLKFKFISLMTSNLLNEMTGHSALAEASVQGFNDQFTAWSLKLNLPVRKDELKRLKRMDRQPGRLVPYFFLKSAETPDNSWNSIDLLSWLCGDKHIAGKFNSLMRETANFSSSGQQFILQQWLHFLQHEMALADLPDLLQDLPGKLKLLLTEKEKAGDILYKSGQILDLLCEKGDESALFFKQINHFLEWELRRFLSGQWVMLPYSQNKKGQNFLFFKRRMQQEENPEPLEFFLLLQSAHWGELGIGAALDENSLDLTLYSDHQDFIASADKSIMELKTALYKCELTLKKYQFRPQREMVNFMNRNLFNVPDNKLEVFI